MEKKVGGGLADIREFNVCTIVLQVNQVEYEIQLIHSACCLIPRAGKEGQGWTARDENGKIN